MRHVNDTVELVHLLLCALVESRPRERNGPYYCSVFFQVSLPPCSQYLIPPLKTAEGGLPRSPARCQEPLSRGRAGSDMLSGWDAMQRAGTLST